MWACACRLVFFAMSIVYNTMTIVSIVQDSKYLTNMHIVICAICLCT
nr:MAG TPA: hypothetical protein [Caudoviricetes sp.]